MRIDLHDRQRAAPLIGREHRDRHGIIAPKHDGNCACVQDRAHRPGDLRPVARRVVPVQPVEVAEIDDAPRVGRILEQGGAHIEIELLSLAREKAGGSADGGGRQGGMALLRRIVGRGFRNAEDRDGRPVEIMAGTGGQAGKGLEFGFFRHADSPKKLLKLRQRRCLR